MKQPLNGRYHAALAAMLIACAVAMAYLIGDETPYGRVQGTLVTAESGAVLPQTLVSLGKRDPAYDWAKVYIKQYTTRTDWQGHFTFPAVAVGDYHLIPHTNVHEAPETTVHVAEGKVTQAVYELKPSAPFLRVFERQRVFTTSESAKLRVHGFAPVNAMTVSTYRVSPQAALRAWHGSMGEALQTRSDLHKADLSTVSGLTLHETHDIPITRRDIEGVFREEVPLGNLKAGMYVVSFDTPDIRAMSVVTVTNIGIIAKGSPREVFVYAADLKTGEPVAGASVGLRRNDTAIGTGTTDANGMLSLPMTPDRRGNAIDVVARSGDSMAVATLWGYGEYGERENLKVYTYTERPVYRPGQTVYLKSIVRQLMGERYRVPSTMTARLRVTDGRENVVYTGNLSTNGHGSLNTHFALNREAVPGPYTVSMTLGGYTYDSSFMVAEYRKPEYEVTVTPERKRYTQRETVRATISAEYYYGAPVPDAQVRWYVTRSPSWYFEDTGEWDQDLEQSSMGEYSDGGEMVTEGEGKLDAGGRLNISFSPEPQREEETPEEYMPDTEDWSYTVHATVQDASKRSVDGSGAMLVTQGAYRLVVTPDDYLAKPGQAVGVSILAVDYDDKPVPGATGTLRFWRSVWKDHTEEKRDVSEQEWRADDQGRATVSITPSREGDWEILARSTDRDGNEITSPSSLWVMGKDAETFDYPYQDLQMQVGRKLYHEGETAEIVVNTRHSPQTALLTLEGARIVDKRLVHLAGNSNVISVPITQDMMPGVRASLSFFHVKRFISGEATINVSRERKALKIQVAADKQTYLPGETAVYRVKTLAPDGKPVPAEVSLGVVDEAIYAIAPDSTPNIVSFFYPMRVDEVHTSISFPDVYVSGDDKAGSTIRTRRFFPDTAFWTPSTVTDDNGEATFRVSLPDNLTTWRATVRAATLDTRVGQTTSQAVVRKPFLVRLETPRFFTQDDTVEIAGVVHNLTGAPVTATAGLDPGSLQVDGNRSDRRKIDNGKTERFAWRVKAPVLGPTTVRVWAMAGGFNDAMELTLPVLPRGRAQTDGTSGSTNRLARASFPVRQDVVQGSQKLTVRLAPSLVSSMLGSLDYLATYPYGCTEQTMSSFLPDIVLYQMLSKQGLDEPDLRRRLPDMVQAGLLKVSQFQHEDGGWRWWRYDESDPWMTAYAVFGLVQARDAGFTVNDQMLRRGVSALASMATSSGKKQDADTRAFAAYVLALAGQGRAAQKVTADFAAPENGNLRINLTEWGDAMLALACARTGQPDRARSLINAAWASFVHGRFYRRTHQDVWPAGQMWHSDGEYGAALLYAACEITPNDPLLPKLVQWLMDQRREDHWYSTRDTAMALYGLSRYVALTKELRPDLDVTVLVNGKSVYRRHFTAVDVMQPEAAVTVDAPNLPVGQAETEVHASGTGRVYYSVTLQQMTTEDMNAPLSNGSGLHISRVYQPIEPGRTDQDEEPPGTPVTSQTRYDAGDLIEVTLTIRSDRALDYVMVEDPLPAGTEPPDRGPVDPYEWSYWWADQIARDQMMAFAIRHLEPGVQRIRYRIVAQTPGTFTALPPRIYDMYNPAEEGAGPEDTVEVGG